MLGLCFRVTDVEMIASAVMERGMCWFEANWNVLVRGIRG